MTARSLNILPSELARLVYGYLFDEIEEIALKFLRQSRYLAESCELYDNGYIFKTDYNGLALKELIHDYCAAVHLVDRQLKSSGLAVEGRLIKKLTTLLSCGDDTRSQASTVSSTRLSEIRHESRSSSIQREREVVPSIQRENTFDLPQTTELFQPECNSSPLTDFSIESGKRKRQPPKIRSSRKKQMRQQNDNSTTEKQMASRLAEVLPSSSPAQRFCAESLSRPDSRAENRIATRLEEVPGSSPAQRFGVDKDTFMSNVELEREKKEKEKNGGKMTRSRSMSDLRLHDESLTERRRKRPKFFTPNKRCAEPTEEVIKATLKELYDNRELHEKMARSINQAREEVSVETVIDEAMASIIEKTTSDPVFSDIIEQTLGDFDLLTYLKPAAKPVASVKDRLRNASTRNSRGEKVPKTRSQKEPVDTTVEHEEITAEMAYEAAKKTAELQPYPEIHYDPADCNIVTGSLDAEGNCVFYSNPKVVKPGLSLPPASSTHAQSRYRNILPKFDHVTLRDLHPVVVCTPIMPPPAPPIAVVELPVKGRKTGKRSSRRGSATNSIQEEEQVSIFIPPEATPARDYSDMPTINFFATPQSVLPTRSTTPVPPTSPKAELPLPKVVSELKLPSAPPQVVSELKQPSAPPKEATPAVPVANPPPEITPDGLPPPRRHSLSTPRRKSYVRTLEFETPGKRCATSPKGRPPSANRTPRTLEDSVLNLKQRLAGNLTSVPETDTESPDKPPVATLVPGRKKLSNVWDALSGVGCVLGQSTEVSQSAPVYESTVNESEPVNGSAWDSNLRVHVNEGEFCLPRKDTPTTKPPKRVRKTTKKPKPKPKKSPKPRRKAGSPKGTRRVTRSKTIVSPSKINATSKRSTYSISNGSSSAFETSSSADEGSTMIEVVDINNKDLVEMTPAKFDDPPTVEDTPFTKLLKENVASVDIDLSMIQTPFFPITPGLLEGQVTPMHVTRATDYSSSSSYYKPELTSPASCLKDIGVTNETVEALQQSEEHLEDVLTVSGRNLVVSPEKAATKQNKITDYYASKSIEISRSVTVMQTTVDESSRENLEDTTVLRTSVNDRSMETSTQQNETQRSRSPTMENTADSRPQNHEVAVETSQKPSSNEDKINEIMNEGKRITRARSCVGKNLSFLKMQMIAQCELKLSENIPIRQELEKKRQETVKKMKEDEKKQVRKPRKPVEKPKKAKLSPKKPDVEAKLSPKKPDVVFSVPLTCSTPNNKEKEPETVPEETPAIKNKGRMSGGEITDAKKDIPPFEDTGEYPELSLKVKKKLHVVKHILLLKDVAEYLDTFSSVEKPKITLTPGVGKLFDIMFKWLKHPHKHELEASPTVKDVMTVSLESFKKIYLGMSSRKTGTPVKSAEGGVDYRKLMLKDIDVDRFLSKLHGRETGT